MSRILDPAQLHYLGNHEILNHYKVAFLCSRKCPAETIIKSYDWAIEERNKGTCVISGFHSQIEKKFITTVSGQEYSEYMR